MSQSGENGLALHGVEVGYAADCPLLGPLDAVLPQGELVALLGRNGTGKSTLLRTLAGDIPPLAGAVLVGPERLGHLSGRKRAQLLAFAPSHLRADGSLSVCQLVMLGRYPHVGWLRSGHDADREAVARAMRMVGVHTLADRRLASLSDGERQRASIALCLAQGAPVLLLDEPSAYLDVSGRAELVHLLRELAHEQGRAVLFSTHDLGTALEYADRLWVIHEGTMRDIRPQEAIGSGLIDAVFSTECVRFDASRHIFTAR